MGKSTFTLNSGSSHRNIGFPIVPDDSNTYIPDKIYICTNTPFNGYIKIYIADQEEMGMFTSSNFTSSDTDYSHEYMYQISLNTPVGNTAVLGLPTIGPLNYAPTYRDMTKGKICIDPATDLELQVITHWNIVE